VQIRDIIAEDLEAAFVGKQDAQSALDDAVKRGNGLLRQFERNTQQQRPAQHSLSVRRKMVSV